MKFIAAAGVTGGICPGGGGGCAACGLAAVAADAGAAPGTVDPWPGCCVPFSLHATRHKALSFLSSSTMSVCCSRSLFATVRLLDQFIQPLGQFILLPMCPKRVLMWLCMGVLDLSCKNPRQWPHTSSSLEGPFTSALNPASYPAQYCIPLSVAPISCTKRVRRALHLRLLKPCPRQWRIVWLLLCLFVCLVVLFVFACLFLVLHGVSLMDCVSIQFSFEAHGRTDWCCTALIRLICWMQSAFRLDKRPGESHLALDGKKCPR